MLNLEQFRATRREIPAGNVAVPDSANDMIIGDNDVKSIYLYADDCWLAVRHDGRFHVYNQYDFIRDDLFAAESDVYNFYATSICGSENYLPMLEAMARDALPINSDDWGTERQVDAENAFFDTSRAIAPHVINEAFDDWCLKATSVEMINAAMNRIKESL